MFKHTKAVAAAAALLFAASSFEAAAQVAASEEAALRQEQAELFKQMFDAPDDVDLMFSYALLSIRLQDYEAAITTLERILIYKPDQPRVKVELGASYYRIGSYPVARQYFSEVAEDPNAAPELKTRVAEFVEEIDRRTQTSYFKGRLGLNAIFTTNANNGPSSRNIEFNGVPAQLLDPDAVEQDDVGASFSANISHFYDLGTPSGDFWRSDLAAYTARYADTSDAAVDVLVLRTGPRLSADDDRYGVKVRPFIEFDHVRYGNDPLHTTIGAGVEVTNTISQQMAVFADLRLGWRDNHTPAAGSNQDGLRLRSRAGLNYFVDEQWSLTGFGLFEYEDADTAQDRNFEIGVGGVASYRYDSGMDYASRRWKVDFGARSTFRSFDEPSLVNPNQAREEVDLRFSVGHTAFLQDGLGFVTKAEYFLRESNSPTFDLDSFTVSAGIRFDF